MLAAEASFEIKPDIYSDLQPDSPQILIADDEPLILELLFRRLTESGFRCECASDGRAASEMLEAREYDLLLTDIMMPGVGGLDLLVRARASSPNIAVILITSVLDMEIAVGALKNGACDYITKPFDLGEVLASVARALDRRRALIGSRTRQQILEAEVERRSRQLRNATEILQQTYHSTLVALGTALDSRESDSGGHSLRVATYAARIGRQMGLDQSQIRVLEQAAVLHDIGKLGVPEALLRNSVGLTAEEEAAVRRHPEIGYRILAGIKHLREAALLIRHQLERYDGTGYPAGLKGDQITPGARIFAVAYQLDSLTSDRSHRRPRSLEKATAEIAACAGTQLDPSVVAAFLEIPLEEWDEIRRSVDGTVRAGNAARRSALAGAGRTQVPGRPAQLPADNSRRPIAPSEFPLPSPWKHISLGGLT